MDPKSTHICFLVFDNYGWFISTYFYDILKKADMDPIVLPPVRFNWAWLSGSLPFSVELLQYKPEVIEAMETMETMEN